MRCGVRDRHRATASEVRWPAVAPSPVRSARAVFGALAARATAERPPLAVIWTVTVVANVGTWMYSARANPYRIVSGSPSDECRDIGLVPAKWCERSGPSDGDLHCANLLSFFSVLRTRYRVQNTSRLLIFTNDELANATTEFDAEQAVSTKKIGVRYELTNLHFGPHSALRERPSLLDPSAKGARRSAAPSVRCPIFRRRAWSTFPTCSVRAGYTTEDKCRA